MTLWRPDLSPLVWRVFQRNLLVYRKTWKVSLSFNFFEPLLYLGALGFGLGAYVQQMEGVPYLNYLAPGLLASSAMFATTYECTYGSFVRMAYQRLIMPCWPHLQASRTWLRRTYLWSF